MSWVESNEVPVRISASVSTGMQVCTDACARDIKRADVARDVGKGKLDSSTYCPSTVVIPPYIQALVP